MGRLLIQFCVAVLWQLGASDPLFLNSRKDQAVLLTTPPSLTSELERSSVPEQTLVLNSRGVPVLVEGETVQRLRVRRPRKTEQGAVAPLDHMKAPPGDSQTPVSRQGRQSNFALATQNQAPNFGSQPSFLPSPPNRNDFRNLPRGQRQFGQFGQFRNNQFRNNNQGNLFESNRQTQSNFNNNLRPGTFQPSFPFSNSQAFQQGSSFPEQNRAVSSPPVRRPTEVTTTTSTTTSTTPAPTTTTTTITTSASTTPATLRTSPAPAVTETRQPRVLPASTFRPSAVPVFNQRQREGRTGAPTPGQRPREGRTGGEAGGYYPPPPPPSKLVYRPPPTYASKPAPTYGKQPFYKITKMQGTDWKGQNFDYMYSTENKINVMGTGYLKTVCDEEVSVMKGSYDYYGTDGKKYKVDWYADETGFHPSADHLPQPVKPNHPEVAAAVAAQLKYAAKHHRARRASPGYGVPCPPKYSQPKYVPPPSYAPAPKPKYSSS